MEGFIAASSQRVDVWACWWHLIYHVTNMDIVLHSLVVNADEVWFIGYEKSLSRNLHNVCRLITVNST